MFIGEFWEWLLYFEMQASRHDPPSVKDVGLEAMAAGLGVPLNGR